MTLPTSDRQAVAFLDCFSGISGDMFLGALIHAGLPLEVLTTTLKQLDLDGYRIVTSQVGHHSAIQGLHVEVMVEGKPPCRDWQDIQELIHTSRLSATIKSRALSIFQVLAETEAKVHGCPVAEVHFHEVGAVDSIVDIVGAAIGLDYFAIDRLTCSPLPLANGWVKSAHGVLPLPAPAVCEILKDVPVYGVALDSGESHGMELVTPTGAAIAKACAHGFGPLPAMSFSKVGYGAGSKHRPDGQPNLLRLIIGEGVAVAEAQQVTIIETNLDDWPPESFPYLCERLFAEGALDVTLTPIQMKKGRPGFTLQVIAPPALSFALQQVVLTETSAIGLRLRQEQRRTLPRSLGSVETRAGKVRVKLIESPDGLRMTPEYEDCRRIASESGLTLAEVYRAVAAQTPDQFQPDPPDKGHGHHDPSQ
jgi:uncharacterized protein (TIGR00299 family) protein